MVLPVRGGATIRPRCPRPIGVNRSTTRIVNGPPGVSKCSGSVGSIAVVSFSGLGGNQSFTGMLLIASMRMSL